LNPILRRTDGGGAISSRIASKTIANFRVVFPFELFELRANSTRDSRMLRNRKKPA